MARKESNKCFYRAKRSKINRKSNQVFYYDLRYNDENTQLGCLQRHWMANGN